MKHVHELNGHIFVLRFGLSVCFQRPLISFSIPFQLHHKAVVPIPEECLHISAFQIWSLDDAKYFYFCIQRRSLLG